MKEIKTLLEEADAETLVAKIAPGARHLVVVKVPVQPRRGGIDAAAAQRLAEDLSKMLSPDVTVLVITEDTEMAVFAMNGEKLSG